MIWLPDPFDRRKTYYVQHLSALSLVVVGYLYSGALANKTITSYHALLIAYLSFGNAANGELFEVMHAHTDCAHLPMLLHY